MANKHGSPSAEQSYYIVVATPTDGDVVRGAIVIDEVDASNIRGYLVNTIGPTVLRELGFEYDWAVNFIIDGGGSVITTGVKGYVEMPFAGTIESNRILPDQSGSIVIDVWKDTYANYPPTDADSITASAPPTLTATTKSEDTTLTGWTTTFSAGDILGFNCDSVTTVTRVTLSLRGRHT